MSGHENTSAPVSTRPRAWDFMETVFVALIAYATYHLALWIVILVLWSMPDGLKWSLDQLGLESVADIVGNATRRRCALDSNSDGAPRLR